MSVSRCVSTVRQSRRFVSGWPAAARVGKWSSVGARPFNLTHARPETSMTRTLRLTLAIAALGFFALAGWGAAVKFYPDDPILREPEKANASDAKPWDIDLFWDLAYNLFA